MIELARDEKVDAIIVGTGQKTGLGRLGSVSSVIVHDAPQSVVCVPPQAQIADAHDPARSARRSSRPTSPRSRTAPSRTRSR